MDKHGIPAESWDKIISILTTNPRVDEIILFGSRAMGKHKPGSDIDIALRGKELRHQDMIDLLVAYDELDLPWELDILLIQKTTDPEVLSHIERHGQIVWQR